MSDVSLTLSKEVVLPIVEAKIKDAITAALGGSDTLVEKMVDMIINQKVNSDGKVSSYRDDNKFTWLDVIVTEQIKTAVRDELKVQISKSSESIKEALIAQLQTKKGANAVASALMAGLESTFKSCWTSTIAIAINPPKKN